jgi:hypothetical protein
MEPATIKPILLLAACGRVGDWRWLGWVVVIMMAPF